MKLEGVITALVTPFTKEGEVDYPSLKRLILDQLDQGLDGFVVHGTTSESPTTTEKEKEKIFEFVKSEVSGHVPLIAGTGSNSTKDTIEKSKKAESWGADAVLVVVPYYNKPPQRGLVQHFNSVANSVEIPTVLYNVPGRTITALELNSIIELSENKKIIGIKEATGNIEFGAQIINKTHKNFSVVSGDDKTCVDLATVGGLGVIGVASHIIGKEMKDSYLKVKNQKELSSKKTAAKEYEKYFGFIDSIYLESNPIPIKYALFKAGIISTPQMRLPLAELKQECREILDQKMKELGLC